MQIDCSHTSQTTPQEDDSKMKIQEISQKPAIQQHQSGSDAYAKAAQSVWGKPESGNSTDDKLTQHNVGGKHLEKGAAGKPGGGGSTSAEVNDGKPKGSSAGEASDKGVPKPHGTGEGGFAPGDKLPADKRGKANGEGSHSEKPLDHKEKQDPAAQHLPKLTII